MTRYHTADEIRRFDLMKLGVLLLLILLLALAWIATRDQQDSLATGDQAEGTPAAEGVEGEEVVMPVPTLGIPSVNVPAEPPQPGRVTLSGTAGPGAQVVILVNGIPSGVAVTGVDGARADTARVSVTYWMNRLQGIDPRHDVFVSLNPIRAPRDELTVAAFEYSHPAFDAAAVAAQRQLAGIQGRDRIWFCGSYCGYGFHEDALSSGLAVAEALGARRPWAVERPVPSRAPVAARLAVAEAGDD